MLREHRWNRARRWLWLAAISCAACLTSPPTWGLDVDVDPIPSYYQESGLAPNREALSQNTVEHIDPFSGKLQFHHVDLFLPGNGGFDIRIQRSYSSGDGFLRDPSPYGVGWTMGFGRVLRRAAIDICVTTEGAAEAHGPADAIG